MLSDSEPFSELLKLTGNSIGCEDRVGEDIDELLHISTVSRICSEGNISEWTGVSTCSRREGVKQAALVQTDLPRGATGSPRFPTCDNGGSISPCC